jgi:hypothetical protein
MTVFSIQSRTEGAEVRIAFTDIQNGGANRGSITRLTLRHEVGDVNNCVGILRQLSLLQTCTNPALRHAPRSRGLRRGISSDVAHLNNGADADEFVSSIL